MFQIHLTSSLVTLLVVAVAFTILLMTPKGQRLWRRKYGDTLIRSEERFRLLVEAVKDYAIFMLDLNGIITTWNPGAQRINGYSEKEIIGKHVSVFYKQDDIINATADKELKSARENGHFESEGQRVRKDGTLYWASIVITPLLNASGTITGYSKVTRDITQFKESEKHLRLLNEELENRVRTRTFELARRENQLRSITNALPALIAQLDQNEIFTFANEAFETWFEQPVVGKSFQDVLGPERYPFNRPFIQKVLNGEMTTYERDSISGEKSAILSITFVPELDSKSEVSGFIVLANDITKYKEIQEELKKAKDAAEVANATKSYFLANMSHEIRTPLGAVLGFSELLLNGNMNPEEQANSVEVIKRNGQLLSNIINDILDLSKVEAGKLEIEKVEVPFNEVMKEISSSLHLGATEKGLDLVVNSEASIPSQIKTDPLRLRQILFNVIGNAIKFTHRGSIHITFKMLNGQDGATKLAVVVKDTGEGIQPEQIERLFTPFTQADVSTTRKFGGTGLGLALSKKLARALGGDLELIETTPGKGSTFQITIDPGTRDQISSENSKANYSSTSTNPIKKEIRLDQMKILLVDDSLDNQLLIKRILNLAGASVDTAGNGREGAERALIGNFDLILMDLQMPEMDGYEATKLLRDKGYKKPIIALTAHAMKEERQRSLANGFDNHITKPIDHKLLVDTLSSYI